MPKMIPCLCLKPRYDSTYRQIPENNIDGIMTAVISQLQMPSLVNSKMIVGPWNGDSYCMSGSKCLILQVTG